MRIPKQPILAAIFILSNCEHLVMGEMVFLETVGKPVPSDLEAAIMILDHAIEYLGEEAANDVSRAVCRRRMD